ncbi:GNAT family N-acetyltransferase [Hymenobacter sp. B1770]|uniref:GNAT family N-acetyltransferase n=1 Tax=Hymenobacter sp. B1770 TaxID=1718788 RepID=UPI003CED54A9
MSSPLRISLAKANAVTAAQLADLGRRTFQDAFAAANTAADMEAYLGKTFGPDIQLAELQGRENTFLLAHMQSELVGYAKLRDNSALGLPEGQDPAGRLEIERLYVRDDWQGTGLGAALMRGILALAEQLHCSAVVLGVWEKNERARAFYQRFGFREIGQHNFQLGQDVQIDLILRKGMAGR